ncbi:multidrug effflux MFS transporter [Pelomonas sp. KK5]|uniref:multidrug effflux MFS transporter n=1 Tax=Pelomonas sp. KK5 TaxID=1855730 RepID=UPI00097C5152|nr:multidrug effflux MFS transporter [Pelomonas sp. KK5]
MSSSPRLFRMALVLGLLSAIGPFAIDMYLPALPDIGQALQADGASVQMSLTAFFVSIGLGQLLYGPLSDMFGRKPPLYAGLLLFTAASIGCALSSDVHVLIVLRFFQGLGAAAGMVIPRAIVRDLHTGTEAAKLMSLLMLVFSVSPILAPLTGSAVIAAFSWRAVFWAVTLAALAGIALMATTLAETRGADERRGSGMKTALRGYWFLLRDRHFMGLVLIGSFGISGFFIYLANSPFVMIGHYGLSPQQYSLAFALNAASFIGVSQFAGKLGERYGMVPVVKASALACAVAVAALLAYYLAGGDSLAVLIGGYLVASAFMGLVIPMSSVLSLDEHGEIAGTASALLGTVQMLAGAVLMAVSGPFIGGRPLPMVAGMFAGALLALLMTWGTLGAPRRLVAAADGAS